MGLFLGSFRQPQKSDAYVSIGSTRESNRCVVVGISFLKSMTNLVFIAPRALKPRSFRSAKAVLKLMEGVMVNPKYVYSFVTSNFVFPNQHVLLIRRPVLLKTIHFVFSRLTSIKFFILYVFKLHLIQPSFRFG